MLLPWLRDPCRVSVNVMFAVSAHWNNEAVARALPFRPEGPVASVELDCLGDARLFAVVSLRGLFAVVSLRGLLAVVSLRGLLAVMSLRGLLAVMSLRGLLAVASLRGLRFGCLLGEVPDTRANLNSRAGTNGGGA